MNFPTRPCAALLLACAAGLACADDTTSASVPAANAPIDQTGDDGSSFAAQYVSHGISRDKGKSANFAAFDYTHPDGWTAGSATSRADSRFVDNGRVAMSLYGGYRGNAGPLAVSTIYTYYSYPGARRGLTGAGYDFGELSTGLRYQSLYARYNYTTTRDFFGVPDARGSGYLDLGMCRDLEPDHRMSVMLHAGDGHVAGEGNAIWDWRDLKAGVNRKLDSGWVVAMNYTRAFGAAGPYVQYSAPGGLADDRHGLLNLGRRALVLNLKRSF